MIKKHVAKVACGPEEDTIGDECGGAQIWINGGYPGGKSTETSQRLIRIVITHHRSSRQCMEQPSMPQLILFRGRRQLQEEMKNLDGGACVEIHAEASMRISRMH